MVAFRIVTAHGVTPPAVDPDLLYAALDALGEPDNDQVVLLPAGDDERFLRITATGDGPLTIRWRDGRVTGADRLATHQAVLRCLTSRGGWRPLLEPLQDSHGRGARVADYAATGLSVAHALLDAARRGLPGPVPWGGHGITAADEWRDIPDRGRLLLRVERYDPDRRLGVALTVPGGVLTCGPVTSGPELILWPGAGALTIGYLAPDRLLRVCPVYAPDAADRTVTDRGAENAALWASTVGDRRRYHCNHAATHPPDFTDLVFTLDVRSAPGWR